MARLLIIGQVWPEPSTTAAGHRMLQIIKALKDHWDITFATTATTTEYSFDLTDLGIRTQNILLNHSSFDDFITGLNPEVVVFDRFMVEEQFGWRVSEKVPKALRVLNTEDLHSLRKCRGICHQKSMDFTTDVWLDFEMTKREVASIYRSDLSLFVSSYEMELLTENVGVPQFLLIHLPFMLDVDTETETPSFNSRQDFITFGNGRHAPNVDAIHFLYQEIWPLIRQSLPNAKMKVYGAYLPHDVTQLHKPERGFEVLGWCENLDAEIQESKVCLAPLRFGAGIKGKVVDAIRNGTPVVATSITAEGMHPMEIFDGVEAFAKQAVDLYSNQSEWEKAQAAGKMALKSHYDKKKWTKILLNHLSITEADLIAHRKKNFIGSLLQLNSHSSTKYLSKWIEEKNKNQSQS
ncbi:MAG: glycosyltransferase [Bacteroidota bacterium]